MWAQGSVVAAALAEANRPRMARPSSLLLGSMSSVCERKEGEGREEKEREGLSKEIFFKQPINVYK